MHFCPPRFLKIIYLVLAALGLHCYPWAFSGFGECLLIAEHMQALWSVTHRLSCPAESGIFLNQPSNLCPLHWHTDSHPLCTSEVPLSSEVFKTSERENWTFGCLQRFWHKERFFIGNTYALVHHTPARLYLPCWQFLSVWYTLANYVQVGGSGHSANRSVISDSAHPRTAARQAPLSMGFSKQESWSGLPFSASGDLPNPGTGPASVSSPALQVDFLPLRHWGYIYTLLYNKSVEM